MITAVIRPGDPLPTPPDNHRWVWADAAGPTITVVAVSTIDGQLPAVTGHSWQAKNIGGSRVYGTRPQHFTRGG